MNIIKFLSALLSGVIFAFVVDFEGNPLVQDLLVLVGLIPLILSLVTSQLRKRWAFFIAFSLPIIYEVGQGFWFGLRYFYNIHVVSSIVIYAVWIWLLSSLHWLLIFTGLRKVVDRDLTQLWALPFLWVAAEFLYSLISIQSRMVSMGFFMPIPSFLGYGSRVGGMFAASYVIVFINTLISTVVLSVYKRRNLIRNYGWIMAGVVALGLMMAGYFDQHDPQKTSKLKVALLQPNIPFRLKEDGAIIQRRLDCLIGMSRTAIQEKAKLIIWPASIYQVVDQSQIKSIILSLEDSINKKIFISLGVARVVFKLNEQFFQNTVYLINGKGIIKGVYKKQKLTPYTEYIPCEFMNLLNQKKKMKYLPELGESKIFKIGDVKWGNAICVEMFYPEVLRKTIRKGAEFIVHLSNDDLYGPTNLQRIYKKITCMRALELGVPILRESMTGITCMINQKGIVEKELPVNQKNILYINISQKNRASFYAKYGDLFSILCVMIVLIVILKKHYCKS